MESWVSELGKLPFFIDGDALRGKQLLAVDWLTNASGAQAV